MIMDILNGCLNKEIKIISIKDGFKLEDDISSKVLAFAFGLSAEIERKLISQRTKEALSRLKNKGVKLGRRKGSKNKHTKLEKYTNRIITAFNNGETKANLARKYKVHINTIYAFIEKHNKKIISV